MRCGRAARMMAAVLSYQDGPGSAMSAELLAERDGGCGSLVRTSTCCALRGGMRRRSIFKDSALARRFIERHLPSSDAKVRGSGRAKASHPEPRRPGAARIFGA